MNKRPGRYVIPAVSPIGHHGFPLFSITAAEADADPALRMDESFVQFLSRFEGENTRKNPVSGQEKAGTSGAGKPCPRQYCAPGERENVSSTAWRSSPGYALALPNGTHPQGYPHFAYARTKQDEKGLMSRPVSDSQGSSAKCRVCLRKPSLGPIHQLSGSEKALQYDQPGKGNIFMSGCHSPGDAHRDHVRIDLSAPADGSNQTSTPFPTPLP
jgi:hypothetical protein